MADQNDKLGAYKYHCKECGMIYKNQKTALSCERWCREHKSCNLEIIKQGKLPEEINVT